MIYARIVLYEYVPSSLVGAHHVVDAGNGSNMVLGVPPHNVPAEPSGAQGSSASILGIAAASAGIHPPHMDAQSPVINTPAAMMKSGECDVANVEDNDVQYQLQHLGREPTVSDDVNMSKNGLHDSVQVAQQHSLQMVEDAGTSDEAGDTHLGILSTLL